MKEVDEETRDLLEKTAKLSDSYYLEQLELNDEKVKLIEVFNWELTNRLKNKRRFILKLTTYFEISIQSDLDFQLMVFL
jgi:hypothetical protein